MTASGPSSQRCTLCGECWPPQFHECPQCGESCSPFKDAEPTRTTDEAASILNHRLFEEWLEKEGRK